MRERILQIIKSINTNQSEFAKKIGISQSAISQYLAGQSKGLNSDTLLSIVNEFNINPAWLLTGKGEMVISSGPEVNKSTHLQPVYTGGRIEQKISTIKNELSELSGLLGMKQERKVQQKKHHDDDYIEVPLIGEIAAGTPIVAEQNIEKVICIPNVLLKRRGAHFALHVKGDSMKGAGILNGDIVVLRQVTNPRDQLKNGDIVAALIENSATLKRIYFKENGIELHPDNDEFKIIHLNRNEIFLVQGVLVGAWRYYRKEEW